MALTFTRVVLLLFGCLLAYYGYTMYLLFYPAQCSMAQRHKCLLPAYTNEKPLEVNSLLIIRGNPISSMNI